MEIYYGGCEQPGWRAFLADQGVRTMSLSWYGLRRRRKNLSGFSIRNEFPEGSRVYLDSGAYSVNKDGQITREEAYALCQEYLDFVDANIDGIEFASEFDAQVLGEDLIKDIRLRYWSNLDPQKWMPVWHAEEGVTELRSMAGSYERIGLLQNAGTSSDITGILRTLSSGTSFHGVSMTKMEVMKTLPLTSVGSTSWLSPTQYGDTFIWDGRELHRYPRDYKHRRESHRRWLQENGFDTAKIEGDDNNELLRLSVWSWQEFAKSIQPRGTRAGVTNTVLDPFSQIAETDVTGVAISTVDMRNNAIALREERVPLPLLTTVTQTEYNPDGTETARRMMRSPGVNLLQCDTCHINDVCPMMRPGNECAYEIPVEIRTTTQLAALQDTLIELQTQRVLRSTMFEQVQGGSIDKNTSQEYDRLNRMISAKVESTKDSVSIKIEATGAAARAGFVSNMFGRDAGERATALPQPMLTEGYIEAEIIED
jgi:hypothetical protein